MDNDPNEDLRVACENGDVEAANIAIEHGASDWNSGLSGACQYGYVSTEELMIAHGATDFKSGLIYACIRGHVELVKLIIDHEDIDWNWGLAIACQWGYIAIAELMIAHGANNWNRGLFNACYGGHIELAKLMIAHGANNWDTIIHYGNQNTKEYIKAQLKLHDIKAVPIIRMLRRYIKRFCNAKRIQRWWRGTYPLWRELAYAPPNGLRYRQSLEHFTQTLKLFKKY